MDMYENALNVARQAHFGQVDKAGKEYILHPIAVAESHDPIKKVVALLHDVVEDSNITAEEIRSQFGDEIGDAVDAITHREKESYMEYVKRVAKNPVVKAVKIADLRHNMQLSRLPVVTDKDIERVEKKYKPALAYLLSL